MHSWEKLLSLNKEKLIGKPSNQKRSCQKTSLKKTFKRERRKNKRLPKQRPKNRPRRQRERAIAFSFMVRDSRDVEMSSPPSSLGMTKFHELANVSGRTKSCLELKYPTWEPMYLKVTT